MRVSRIPGMRKFKLYKWSQWFLVIGIVGFLCIIRADKVLWESNGVKISRDILAQAQNDLLNSKDHVIEPVYSLGNEVAESKIHAHTTDILYVKTKNKVEKSTSKLADDMGNKTISHDLDEEVKAIIKSYVERNKEHQVERVNSSSSLSALYREIPPVYDDLIKVVMNTRERCKDAGDYNSIIAVHTAPNHFENRAAFRWLYGDYAKTNPYRFKLVFFIGLVTNSTLQEELKKENEDFGDTVQGNYIDAYINMTYKAIMVFDWLDTHCQGMRSLLRLDDDVFMNIQRVYPRWTYVQRFRKAKTIMCFRLNNDHVLRTGKWAVPQSLVSGSKYEFMRCPGYFAAVTVDLIHDMNVQAKKVPFFWIDDIVMLGLVPNAVGGVFFYPFNKWMALPKHSDVFYKCIQQQGSECPYWVGITDVENFQKLYGYQSGSIPLVKDPYATSS